MKSHCRFPIEGLTLKGIWSLSGGTIRVGTKKMKNTKKLIKLAVSTCAEAGRVLAMCTHFGPIMAPRMILTAWPPQYSWMPICNTCKLGFQCCRRELLTQMVAVISLLRTGQKPPRIPHELVHHVSQKMINNVGFCSPSLENSKTKVKMGTRPPSDHSNDGRY